MLELILASVFDRGFFLTLQAIRRQLAGMPNDFYFIRLMHGSTHRPAAGERLWTTADVAQWFAFCAPATVICCKIQTAVGFRLTLKRRILRRSCLMFNGP